MKLFVVIVVLTLSGCYVPKSDAEIRASQMIEQMQKVKTDQQKLCEKLKKDAKYTSIPIDIASCRMYNKSK